MVDATPGSPHGASPAFPLRAVEGLLPFDQEIVDAADWTDIAPELVTRFRGHSPQEDLRGFARKIGLLARRPASDAKPTVAGVLVASKTPERWLPNAFIEAFLRRGREGAGDRGDAADAVAICGPLPAQVANACRFVFLNQRRGPDGFHQYDIPAVFEAVLNAVLHRDHSLYRPRVRLSLLPDRLEIFSPGPLVGSMEVEHLGYRAPTRNRTINSLLLRLPVPRDGPWMTSPGRDFIDRPGRGVDLILTRSEAHSGRTPEYRMLGDSGLQLTIFAAAPDEPRDAGDGREARHGAG